MGLLKIYRKLSLSLKLNTILIVASITGIVALLFVISSGFTTLLFEVGQERLEQEAQLAQQHFQEQENEVLSSARLLGASPGLAEAMQTENFDQVRQIIELQARSLGADDADVVNTANERVLAVDVEGVEYDVETEDRLLLASLAGDDITGIMTEEEADERDVLMAASVPIKNDAGEVVGAVLFARHIDDEFITHLDFDREDIHFGFIYDGDIVARDLDKPEEIDEIEVDEIPASVWKGETWISDELEQDEDNTPDLIAYAPVTVGGEVQGVIPIRYEFDSLLVFQDNLRNDTLLVIVVIVILVILGVFLFMRSLVTYPLSRLANSARKLAEGDLSQRVVVKTEDEIGRLGAEFNTMADQLAGLVDTLKMTATDALEAKTRAERSDQIKSAFLASMSHELRTPLNSVINFTKFVSNGVMGPVNDEQVSTLQEVIDSAEHLLNLINDVLDMSKIESGSLNLFVEDQVDLKPVIKTVASTAESLKQKEVALQVEISEDLPAIRGDKQRILQILLNIMSNACKFTEQGVIKLSAQQHNGEVQFSIHDTGPGIPPEDLEAVFEPFRQTSTGVRQGQGTGLGMPISKNLAEAHGGRLWVESQPGHGTTFFVALPVRSEKLTPVRLKEAK